MFPKIYTVFLFLVYLKFDCEGFDLKTNRSLLFDIGPPYKIIQNAYNNSSNLKNLKFDTIVKGIKYSYKDLTKYKDFLKTIGISKNISKTQEYLKNRYKTQNLLFNRNDILQSEAEIVEPVAVNANAGKFVDENLKVISSDKIKTGKYVDNDKKLHKKRKYTNLWKTEVENKPLTEIESDSESEQYLAGKQEQTFIDDIEESEEDIDTNIHSKIKKNEREKDKIFINRKYEYQFVNENQEVEDHVYGSNAEEDDHLNDFQEIEDEEVQFDDKESKNIIDQNDEEFDDELYLNSTENFPNLESPDIISDFHEDFIESSLKNESIIFSVENTIIKPKIFVHILNSSGSAFYQLPSNSVGNEALLYHDSGPSSKRKTCRIPKHLAYSELKCTRSHTITCKQRCVFGYTLKEGIQRVQRCQNGIWSPSIEFNDCKPFVDCTVQLKPGGEKKCYSNYLRKAPSCEVKCQDSKSEAKMHSCDLNGNWHPSLPSCAAAGTGQMLVERPQIVSELMIHRSKRRAEKKEKSKKSKKRKNKKKNKKKSKNKKKNKKKSKNKKKKNKKEKKNKKNKEKSNKNKNSKKNKKNKNSKKSKKDKKSKKSKKSKQ